MMENQYQSANEGSYLEKEIQIKTEILKLEISNKHEEQKIKRASQLMLHMGHDLQIRKEYLAKPKLSPQYLKQIQAANDDFSTTMDDIHERIAVNKQLVEVAYMKKFGPQQEEAFKERDEKLRQGYNGIIQTIEGTEIFQKYHQLTAQIEEGKKLLEKLDADLGKSCYEEDQKINALILELVLQWDKERKEKAQEAKFKKLQAEIAILERQESELIEQLKQKEKEEREVKLQEFRNKSISKIHLTAVLKPLNFNFNENCVGFKTKSPGLQKAHFSFLNQEKRETAKTSSGQKRSILVHSKSGSSSGEEQTSGGNKKKVRFNPYNSFRSPSPATNVDVGIPFDQTRRCLEDRFLECMRSSQEKQFDIIPQTNKRSASPNINMKPPKSPKASPPVNGKSGETSDSSINVSICEKSEQNAAKNYAFMNSIKEKYSKDLAASQKSPSLSKSPAMKQNTQSKSPGQKSPLPKSSPNNHGLFLAPNTPVNRQKTPKKATTPKNTNLTDVPSTSKLTLMENQLPAPVNSKKSGLNKSTDNLEVSLGDMSYLGGEPMNIADNLDTSLSFLNNENLDANSFFNQIGNNENSGPNHNFDFLDAGQNSIFTFDNNRDISGTDGNDFFGSARNQDHEKNQTNSTFDFFGKM